MVTRQLSVCIGIINLHLPEYWEKQLFQQLSVSLQGSDEIMLEILKCVAEAINDDRIVVDDQKRN